MADLDYHDAIPLTVSEVDYASHRMYKTRLKLKLKLLSS